MVAVSRDEPGTVVYDWYVDEAGGVGTLYEAYSSAEALRAHGSGAVFTELAPRYARRGAGRPGGCVRSGRRSAAPRRPGRADHLVGCADRGSHGRAMTIDHDALRVKYREERDKRLRPDGNDQYLEPTGRFASMLDDPYVERVEREPRVRRRDRRADRWRLLGVVRRRAAEAGGHRRRAHHRGRRRLRRHVVLEPLPGRDVRHRGHDLPAAARRDRPHAVREVRHRPRDLRALPAHRHDVRPLRQRAVLDRGHRARVGRGRGALDHPHRPRRRDPRPVRRHGHRVRSTGPSCPASPGSRPSPATASTRAAGTTRTPAATGPARR